MDKPTINNPAECPLQVMLTASLQLGILLEQLLTFTGPADITISTFSSGEEFLIKLHSLKKKGLVTRAVCFTDIKAAEKTARNNTMMKMAYDQVHMCRNHSKVILISGQRLQVAVLTSQNTTRGNRLESYVIINSEETVTRLKSLLTSYYNTQIW